jgi:hypothetical protein
MSKEMFTSPKGDLKWVFVTAPGRLNNLNGQMEYTVSVSMSAEDAAPGVDTLDTLWDENKPKGAKAPKSMGYRVDEETGDVTFNFKTKTTYPSGDVKEIRIYNAKADAIKIPEGTKIGNGSRGRVSGMASIYDAGPAARGVTLYLDAVQLVKFVEYVGADDFESEEDGFDGFGDQLPFTPEELD